jgi:sugar phosphate isomerase/epimerase
MKSFSRRKFVSNSAAAAAVLAIPHSISSKLSLAAFSLSSDPSIRFPSVPRDRLAVASWPFRKEIISSSNEYRDNSVPGMDLRVFAASVRQKFGVPGLEPLSSHFPSTETPYLHEFRNAIEKAGVSVVNIPVDNSDSYCDPDPAGRKRAIQNAVKWMDVAAILGSPSIRTSMPEVKNASPDVNLAAASLKEVVKHAEEKNIVVNLENDNLASEDAFFIVKVIEKVNSGWLHALPDFCNSMMSGNAEFNYSAVNAMFKHAYSICHVKDSEVGDNGRVFQIDLEKTFAILKASNYRGFCSMEFEGQGDPHSGVQKLIEALLKFLA